MKSSQILANRGVKRIILVLLILYSAFMLIPLDGWPSSSIKDQVTIDHCFGIKEYRTKTNKQRIEALERLNEKLKDTNSDEYKYINGLLSIPDDFNKLKIYEIKASIYLNQIKRGHLYYNQNENRLEYTLASIGDPLIKTYEKREFRNQLELLKWIWLLLNYIFWPIILYVVIEISLWIKRGFSQSEEND